MTTEFLFYANLVLVLRLPLLLRDRPVSPLAWSAKSAVEVLALLVFRPSAPLLALAGLSVLLNVLAAPGRRFRTPRPPVHLVLGAVQVLAASVVLAPVWGVGFRPQIGALAAPLREVSALGGPLLALARPEALLVMFGLLLAGNEANLLIRWLLAFLQLKPTADQARPINALEYQRGRVIGLIERAIIYSFVLMGQFAAVGFVLAAKGFSRSRDMKQEDRDFTDYVIIGTLLSAGLAMALGAAVKWAL